MRISRAIGFALIWTAIAFLLFWRFGGSRSKQSAAYPNQPIQVVVPYAAGGGTDTFARIFERTIGARELLPEPLVILNQAGGGGTIGSRFVLASRPDGYRILCLNDALITSELSGTASFGPDDFTVIAQTGTLATAVVVRGDSPFDDLASLLDAAKANPNSLRFGADVGSPAYFNAKVIERSKPGASFNYITSGGGQKRFTQILGGHLEIGIFSLGEYLSFKASKDVPPNQDIKAIAIIDTKRSPLLPDVETTLEQGIAINSANAYFWWAPKGARSEVVDTIALALEEAMGDPWTQSELAKLSIGLDFLKGEKLLANLASKREAYGAFESRIPASIPDFPIWVIGIVGALGFLIIFEHFRKGDIPGARIEWGSIRTASIFAILLLGYISCLQMGLPFSIVTPPALFLFGATIAEWHRSKLLNLAQLALLFSLGSEYLFTSIFSLPL